MLKMLYKSFVTPHLNYCSMVWSHCGVTQSDKLEHVQNYALRIISRKPPRTPSEPLCVSMGLTTLLRRRQNHTLQQVHRCLLGQSPSYLAGKFVSNTSVRDCHITTRGAGQLHLNRPLTEYYQSAFEYEGAKLYNALPVGIRSADNYDKFHTMINKLSLYMFCLVH